MTKQTKKNTHMKPRRSGKSPPDQVLTKRRLWTFRLLTIVIIPALFLGAAELALMVTGYGHPTSYFNRVRIEGQDFLVPNYSFSNRFFPSSLARTPNLSRIPAQKSEGVYRIFVFGESAALGDPEPTYGVSRYLEVLLEKRYPGTEFEVVCVAMTAINSHVILPIARECADLEGDLWLIYMGNNEMIGPFGAGTVFGAKAPGLGFVRTSLALKKTRLGQLLANISARLGSKSQAPDQWGGINMFKQNLLRHNDPKKLRTYENFEGNLNAILKVGQEAGVPILLSTVGSNLKDCSPFASLHREGLAAAERFEWHTLFQEGRKQELAGHYEEALDAYTVATAIDAEYAELQFRIGTCQLALGQTDQARQAFENARDYDALAVRADSRINKILMDAMPGNELVHTFDAAAALGGQSPNTIPGKELFNEHVHYTAAGNYTLAQILAEQVSALLPPEMFTSKKENWLGLEESSGQLALTIWDQVRLWHAEAERVNTMPFIEQTSNGANRSHIDAQTQAIMARVTNNTAMKDRQLYTSALERTPEDTLLIGNYAQFLDGMGKTDEAIKQAERFRTLLPDAWTEYYMAALLAKAGRLSEAEVCLKNALSMRSDFTQAQQLLKQIKYRQ